MKTRIVHTKIWEDSWFRKLPEDGQKLFLYLLTCPSNNLSSVFELDDEVVEFHTGLNLERIAKARTLLKEKVAYHANWWFIKNSKKYCNYSGSKNEVAFQRELSLVPKPIIDTLSIPYIYPIDSPINHKPEIINHKSKTINHKQEKLKSLKEWSKSNGVAIEDILSP